MHFNPESTVVSPRHPFLIKECEMGGGIPDMHYTHMRLQQFITPSITLLNALLGCDHCWSQRPANPLIVPSGHRRAEPSCLTTLPSNTPAHRTLISSSDVDDLLDQTTSAEGDRGKIF
ncbi:hypothetical protein PAMP_024228 [Pampus punctatissimus]